MVQPPLWNVGRLKHLIKFQNFRVPNMFSGIFQGLTGSQNFLSETFSEQWSLLCMHLSELSQQWRWSHTKLFRRVRWDEHTWKWTHLKWGIAGRRSGAFGGWQVATDWVQLVNVDHVLNWKDVQQIKSIIRHIYHHHCRHHHHEHH